MQGGPFGKVMGAFAAKKGGFIESISNLYFRMIQIEMSEDSGNLELKVGELELEVDYQGENVATEQLGKLGHLLNINLSSSYVPSCVILSFR